nr:magnesium/cobalt transporter CorA [Salsipaludibacter albus]
MDAHVIIDAALYDDGRRVQGEPDLAEMVERGRDNPDAFVWVGLFEPEDAEFEEIARVFELHPLAVEDAVKAHQRPKLERYGDSIFLVMKTVGFEQAQDDELHIGEIMVFLGDGFIVTVRHGSFTGLSDIRQRLEDEPRMLRTGAGAVLHSVADRVVDAYEVVLDDLAPDVQDIERQVFAPGRHDLAERLYHAKREVQTIRRAVAPLGDVSSQLAGREPPLHVDPALRPYMRDVHDHVLRSHERLTVLDDLLSDALATNVAQIGLRQNEDMRKISAWVGIVAVPTMVAGIYGMNFEHMPELEWRYGYFVALGLMVAIAFGLYRAFKRTGWL